MSIATVTKNQCCGCGGCAYVCPKKCISLKSDTEGFLYPVVDSDQCVQCGLCEKICTALKHKTVDNSIQHNKSYVGYSLEEKTRLSGSSGGVFSALANYVINSGGVVYGASFNEDFVLKHIRVEDIKNLHNILTSKYIQSDLQGIYGQIEDDLQSGKLTLFCGTPCQIAAVYSVMAHKKLSDNLILVDFICHGVPSPGVWSSYVTFLNKRLGGNLKSVSFRNKIHGWHNYSFTAVSESGRRISESHDVNSYMQSFLSDKNIRRSCFSCTCKPDNYCSDITLGDAWKIEKEIPEWSDDKGISFIAVRTESGAELLNRINDCLNLKETSYEQWCQWNPSLCVSTAQNDDRINFFQSANDNDPYDFWGKKAKVSLKKKIRYRCKLIAKKLRIDNLLRSRM